MVIEIRTYRLRTGSTERFVRVFAEQCLPLLERFGIDVVRFGASAVPEDEHEDCYLIRAFDSVDQLRRKEEEFYGSASWQQGPRPEVLGMITEYHSVVIELPEDAVASLRVAGLRPATPGPRPPASPARRPPG